MRAERLGTLMYHVRRVSKGTGDQSLCVNLTGLEYSMVQETDLDDRQPSDKSTVALKKDQGAASKSGSTLKSFPTTLKKGANP